jgi:large subunit ribosomal protein L25
MKINATMRNTQGSSASRRLRRAGRVPAIVYGAGAAPLNIELDHNEIFHALRKEEFHSSILDMDLGDKAEKVLLRAVQWHAYKPLVLHVDFQRVDANQAIRAKVPLHFVNAESSPAVKLGKNMINHVLNELEISCLPGALPAFIEVDLGSIESGAVIHASQLKLPAGVSFVPHGHDADPVVVTAIAPSGGASAEGEA